MNRMSVGIVFCVIGCFGVGMAIMGMQKESKTRRTLTANELNNAYDSCCRKNHDDLSILKCYGEVEQYYFSRTE